MPRINALVFAIIVTITPVFAQYGIDFALVEDTVQTGTSVITWHFIVTNTGSVPDTYALDLSVIENSAGWYVQHCAGGICAEPGIILTIALNPAAADSLIDVQVFIDSGPDTAILNYRAYSLGDTTQRDSFNLYAISELSVEEEDNHEAGQPTMSVFPNPFSQQTGVCFEVDNRQQSVASIKIYDLSGRVVKSFGSLPYAPSPVHVGWDGVDDGGRVVPEGVYFVRVEGASFAEQQKIVKLQ
ncbi:hypothetical protein AMJ87_02240 [candidate division WOR_3 bacterium SM23_60]|uniref:FlgD/Vpr Ig-like domain-containing protein n=1 Tax=candidate division WOR_3 bacterium SM23_60 TaxID=1703780 RepID=A0A0S8GJV8_UNCW3|nr:MAG: hypothetical protein AMJ87_02240 [candidate division WOR_3 bacterium SM23_60]